jgi:hypothetical protein
MSRRWFVIPALLALAAPLFADEFDRGACVRGTVARVASPQYEIARLFAFENTASVATEDGVSAPMGSMEMIVARIGPDGKLITACVDNEEAARKFLETPVERIRTREPQEH